MPYMQGLRMTQITTVYRLRLEYQLNKRPREATPTFERRQTELEIALSDEASGCSPDLNRVEAAMGRRSVVTVEHESFNQLSDLALDLQQIVLDHKGKLK